MTAPRIIFATPPSSPHLALRALIPFRWLAARYPQQRSGVYEGENLLQFCRLAERNPGALWYIHAHGGGLQYLIHDIHRAGGRALFGVDDDLWHLPPELQDAFPPSLVRDFETTIARADGVVVTTAALAERVKPLNANVCRIPNALPPASALPLRPLRARRRIRRIGISVAAGHQRNLELLRSPLVEVLGSRGLGLLYRRRDLTVVMLGDVPAWADGIQRIEAHRGLVSYAEYLARLATLDLDLLLAPLLDTPFNAAKSATKALEAAVAGAAFVGARVGPYRDLAHGRTCWLVEPTEAAWAAALDELVENPTRVRALAAAGRDWALRTGTIDSTGPLWAEAFGLTA